MAKHKNQLLPDQIVKEIFQYIQRFRDQPLTKNTAVSIFADLVEEKLEKLYPYYSNEEITNLLVKNLEEMSDNNLDFCVNILAIAKWYYCGRQMYKFDEELSKLLSTQNKSDVTVSIETLKHLPCDNFFVERQFNNSAGFFVSVDEEVVTIVDIYPTGISSIICPIADQTTIRDLFESAIRTNSDEAKKYLSGDSEKDQQSIDATVDVICERFQYIVHLSAINAEIEPITKGAIAKRTSNTNDNPKPTTQSKTQISNVGYRIGASLKPKQANIKYVDKNKLSEHHGTPKVPHIRRSHFHSFWTGSGENKTLVVKWIGAVFVNGDKEIDTTTLHTIKEE